MSRSYVIQFGGVDAPDGPHLQVDGQDVVALTTLGTEFAHWGWDELRARAARSSRLALRPFTRLQEFNPYHDKRGRFTSKSNAIGSVGPMGATGARSDAPEAVGSATDTWQDLTRIEREQPISASAAIVNLATDLGNIAQRENPELNLGLPGTATDPSVKHAIVSQLAKDAGVAYGEANAFVKQWAHSANDNDMRSLALQKDIAAEFGVPLSKWQREKIQNVRTEGRLTRALHKDLDAANQHIKEMPRNDETKVANAAASLASVYASYKPRSQEGPVVKDMIADRMRAIEEVGGRAMARDIQDAVKRYASSLPGKDKTKRAAAAEGNVYKALRTQHGFDSSPYERLMPEGKQRKLLRAMYNNTQKRLERAGVTEAIVYRGGAASKTGRLSPGRMRLSAASSWSFSSEISTRFGEASYAARVPRSRILSSFATGFGCRKEREIVVLGGPAYGIYIGRHAW